MNRTFIETTEFTQWVIEYLTDEQYTAIQQELLINPEKGNVMPGCGGLRKLRTGDPGRGKGKRGGCRIIYLDVPDAGVTFFLDIYGKDEKDDLTPGEKKSSRRWPTLIKMRSPEDRKKLDQNEEVRHEIESNPQTDF
jgi:mRNA-degrading endonuclease RelE of RelBE toxin-antitoxin system